MSLREPIRIAALLLLCFATCGAVAQSPAADQPAGSAAAGAARLSKPLPEIAVMMHQVETNQRRSEAIEKEYIYHSVAATQEFDRHGQLKKTVVTEADNFWINGVPVQRIAKKNGKALTPDELAHENERIDKEVAKARERRLKADEQGKETDPSGHEEITVSRWLALGSFTNPRRVKLNGRDTIAVDFTGDPNAKTRNRVEEAVRDLRGTAWIDESDCVLVRIEGEFVNSFKVGGGLVARIQKGTHFEMQQTRVNDEVWLPATITAHGDARMLLFFNFNGSVQVAYSDYKKFRATSTVLPVVTEVDTPPSSGQAAHR